MLACEGYALPECTRIQDGTETPRVMVVAPLERVAAWYGSHLWRHFSIWVLGFSDNLRRIMRFSFTAYSISPAPICKLRHHGASFPQSIPIFATRDCGPQHCKRPDQRRFWRRWILQPLFHMPSKFELLKRAGYRPIKQCKEVHGLPCTQPIGHCLFVLLFWGVGGCVWWLVLGCFVVLGCWVFWWLVLVVGLGVFCCFGVLTRTSRQCLR